MSDTVIVGLIALVGTILSALIGVFSAHSLTKYQIQELTREVREHIMTIIERKSKIRVHAL